MTKLFQELEFKYSPDDPLAAEHLDVKTRVDDALRFFDNYSQNADLKKLPSVKKILDSNSSQACKYVVAAVIQAHHWDRVLKLVRSQDEDEMRRINVHRLPSWGYVRNRREEATAVISSLLRRTLPLGRDELNRILHWCREGEQLGDWFHCPTGLIVRAIERYVTEANWDEEFDDAVYRFAEQLRGSRDQSVRRYATKLNQLRASKSKLNHAPQQEARLRAPKAAPAGNLAVFDSLKKHFGMTQEDGIASYSVVGPDRYEMRDDSPYVQEHQQLSRFFQEVVGTHDYYAPDLRKFRYGRMLLAVPPELIGPMLLAAAERHVHSLMCSGDDGDVNVWQSLYAGGSVVCSLESRDVNWSRNEIFDYLLYISIDPRGTSDESIHQLLGAVERFTEVSPLTEGERFVLARLRAMKAVGPAFGAPSEVVGRLTSLVQDGACFCLAPGEVWTDAVNEEYAEWPDSRRTDWHALWIHALSTTSSRPSKKWFKEAERLVASIGREEIISKLEAWLPLVSKGSSVRQIGSYAGDVRGAAEVMNYENATCLRGLLWLTPLLAGGKKLTRQISDVVLSAYKKVPGVGPRAVKVGNAGVYALSEIATEDAVGQLAMMKVRVKFGTAQKEIEKAFSKAAESLGLPRDAIEEIGVPAYGLEEVGALTQQVGDYQAQLLVNGVDAVLKWSDAKGKVLKSVPTKVKHEHPEVLKELKQSLKDIQSMLPAQRDRIDSMFLLQKSWSFTEWRERYLDHPLIGTFSRRLLWCVDGTPALFVNGRGEDAEGQTIAHGSTAHVTLWHPVEREVDEVICWRTRLENLGVTQPFKQAHREVYLLTDAERHTNTYSNRFAAHVVRQHQFNALCAARGWKNKLRLAVDDCYPPATKDLPAWGLRAEFWIEAIGDEYGVDTNVSGVFLYLSTDQVRFYRTGAAENLAHAGGGGYRTNAGGPGSDDTSEPIPLDQVPPLAFSEIMRDVDLFVGVASVGNDPTWQDGGPEGRYRDYWQSYSFGELSETATTR